MPHIIDRKHNDNKAGLKDVEVPFMRVQISVEASRELNHTVNGAEEDHGRAGVDGPQHCGPACVGPVFSEAARDDVKAEGDEEEEAEGSDLHSETNLEDPEAGIDG